MKKTITLALLFAVAAVASVPCPVATMATYLALPSDGCTFNNVQYYNWKFTPTAALPNTQLSTTDVVVTPTTTSNGSGFVFTFTSLIASGGLNDVEIQYLAKALGGFTIYGLYSEIDGTLLNGTAFGNIVEDYCADSVFGTSLPPSQTCPASNGVSTIHLTIPPGSISTSTRSFAPVTNIAIYKDIQAQGCDSRGFCGKFQVNAVQNLLVTGCKEY